MLVIINNNLGTGKGKSGEETIAREAEKSQGSARSQNSLRRGGYQLRNKTCEEDEQLIGLDHNENFRDI